jgi:hypothetical protein
MIFGQGLPESKTVSDETTALMVSLIAFLLLSLAVWRLITA